MTSTKTGHISTRHTLLTINGLCLAQRLGEDGIGVNMVVLGDDNADDRDEELADAHFDGAPDEQQAMIEALDAPHA